MATPLATPLACRIDCCSVSYAFHPKCTASQAKEAPLTSLTAASAPAAVARCPTPTAQRVHVTDFKTRLKKKNDFNKRENGEDGEDNQ